MCGALNAIADRPEELATAEEIGKSCIHCATTIERFDRVHRSADGEVVHKACFEMLDDEDAHFAERAESDKQEFFDGSRGVV